MLALIATALLAAAPTDGELYQELREDASAFNYADRNGDGRISDREFLRFKRARLQSTDESYDRYGSRLGGHDLNSDYVLTPYELYSEADYGLQAPNYDPYYDAYDDGEFYVDDRDRRSEPARRR